MFLGGLAAGLLTDTVLGLPLQIWFAAGIAIFFMGLPAG